MEDRSSNLIQLLTTSMHQVSQTNDKEKISHIIEKLLMDFTDSDTATLFLFDVSQQSLHTYSNKQTLSMVDPSGIIGEAFLTKQATFYNHLASEKKYIPSIDNAESLKIRSQIVLPIVEGEELLGVVRTNRSLRYNKPYSRKEMDLLYSLQTFLIKIIHILNSDTKIDTPLDISDINKNIQEVSKPKKQVDIDAVMLFLSNTVHDIRTPSNSLYGFLELISERVEDKRLKEFVENAKESAAFINTLTDSILEQTKESHEIQTSRPSIINSVKYFAQIANIFSADMTNKEIDYLIHIDPQIPKEISIDKLKLKRIIINLIGNAYKFTPKGRRIDFRVKYDPSQHKLKISVTDQGIGIDPSRQKDIFNAFEQAEADTSLFFGGTGLGLSISAKYVNDLQGKLKLKSALEQGSKFYFSIPVEVTSSQPSFEPFKNLNKQITILSDCKHCINPENISSYLIELGMPKEKIDISDTIHTDTTHLFCFQHKLTQALLDEVASRQIELLIIEESLFSLSQDPRVTDYTIVSENTYYGDMVHHTVFSEKRKRILIADDNKINLMLLKSILETEYVEITTVLDGLAAFNTLKEAHKEGIPFDAIFLDKHMPSLSGSELMAHFRDYEKEHHTTPIFAISITGDPNLSPEERKLYDMFVKKPFNTESVRDAIKTLRK